MLGKQSANFNNIKMEKLKVYLENCYGIKKLEYNDFDFTKNCACIIYVPNGTMQTSFAKNF